MIGQIAQGFIVDDEDDEEEEQDDGSKVMVKGRKKKRPRSQREDDEEEGLDEDDLDLVMENTGFEVHREVCSLPSEKSKVDLTHPRANTSASNEVAQMAVVGSNHAISTIFSLMRKTSMPLGNPMTMMKASVTCVLAEAIGGMLVDSLTNSRISSRKTPETRDVREEVTMTCRWPDKGVGVGIEAESAMHPST